MNVIVNGKEKKLNDGATLKDAIVGEKYVDGTLISVHTSTDKLMKQSEDFEIITDCGSIIIHLEKNKDAEIWRASIDKMKDVTLRWKTEKINAFGSFPTDIEVKKEEKMYRPYDCFFSLGGFDNATTYFMIARKDHRGMYGAGTNRIGHITKGRHILDKFREGDHILDIKPVVSEESSENVIVTKDLKFKLNDGYKIDTHVLVKLDENSPESAEHLLIIGSKGYLNMESTGSFATCSDDQDITMSDEPSAVRDFGSVSVRANGVGIGRVYFYKERRQMVSSHNHIGEVIGGMSIVNLAKSGDKISIATEPERIMSVGMTQKEAAKFLESKGIKQIRKGLDKDDAIIVEQIPERTMDALKKGEVETVGIAKEKIQTVTLDRKKSPISVHYFEKVTGLSHKPIGSLKIFFMFEGMPMIQFEGDTERGSSLYPDDPFKKCKKGDLGLTNQARPNAGLIGVRLEDSTTYGPTGEEGYGTNIFGKFEGNLDKFVKELKEDEPVYIMEAKS